MDPVSPLSLVPLLLAVTSLAALAAEPRFYSVPPGALAAAQARVKAGDSELKPVLARLLSDADKALKMEPLSVMAKPTLPDSGDRHDYMSQAPYFWPDPSKPDGRPYIRRDGQRNPEAGAEHSDAPRWARTAYAAETLALAYAFSHKAAYAQHAAKLLRIWYLAPETRMNPNLNFAQAIPGVNSGRGTGMIESRSVLPSMDAAALLAGSPDWTKADDDGFRAWMSTFLDWAQTSKNGRAEAAAPNNHGSFYDLQTAQLALFTGQEDLARRIAGAAGAKRIAVQFKADGAQPLELAREDSFSYSRFNLVALCALATVGQHVGVDLWHYQSPEGASLKKGLEFLLPYVEDPAKPWPYQHEKKDDRNLSLQLWQAAAAYGDPHFAEVVRRQADFGTLRARLFYPGGQVSPSKP